MATDRTPYVGTGEDGARRSARTDREAAEQLSWSDPRYDELNESARQWEDQAHRLMLLRIGARPSLIELRMSVGNEAWLAAIALLNLSPALANDASRYTAWSRDSGRYTYTGEGDDKVGIFTPDAEIDWEAWIADVETAGRGWSSTEHRLFDLVAALVTDRPVRLTGVIDSLGSWERAALEILVDWVSGGNNRERAGRYRIADA